MRNVISEFSAIYDAKVRVIDLNQCKFSSELWDLLDNGAAVDICPDFQILIYLKGASSWVVGSGHLLWSKQVVPRHDLPYHHHEVIRSTQLFLISIANYCLSRSDSLGSGGRNIVVPYEVPVPPVPVSTFNKQYGSHCRSTDADYTARDSILI